MEYDFGGWATRNDLRCADGVTIRRDAFKHNDGEVVPLVWNHDHNKPDSVCGHALLENRPEGVYTYGSFNNTPIGEMAKELVQHGDITALSIYANHLTKKGNDVVHGTIREVSLVLAGANPGAGIDFVLKHGEECEDEAYIYTDEVIQHADEIEFNEKTDEDDIGHADSTESKKEGPEMEKKDKTVADIIETMNEEQKTVLYALVGKAVEDKDEEDPEMKHNAFDNETAHPDDTLTHAEQLDIISDAKRYGSVRDSALAHGIEQIDYLFPEAQTLNNPPAFIQRDMGWVSKVMGAIHKTPFSRIKSMFADITEDDARARGYMKGNLKKDEVFSLLKRTTSPTTIYKKQKMDRDDVIDIKDFDVIAWLKSEMRMMLDEEIARAILVGDGRLASSDDKIDDNCIRPVWTDDALYTVKARLPEAITAASNSADRAKAFIRAVIKSRKDYKGSGSPTLYTTEDVVTDCLLLEDQNGRLIYDSVEKLATVLRVKEIVTVSVMEGLKREDSGTWNLMGLIVNLADYNVGADKGGAVNMFDDFDIDYNQQKYLIETRCSGALVKPHSAIAVEFKQS